jgi:hypothetical protein
MNEKGNYNDASAPPQQVQGYAIQQGQGYNPNQNSNYHEQPNYQQQQQQQQQQGYNPNFDQNNNYQQQQQQQQMQGGGYAPNNVQVVVVQQPFAPSLIDLRSPQQAALDNDKARREIDDQTVDSIAWCCLSCFSAGICLIPFAYVSCCGDGNTGYERPCGKKGCSELRGMEC